MEKVDPQGSFFFRSLPSQGMRDGLCQNIAGVLDCLEEHDFDDVVLETVGIGQGEYASRNLVDTLVVVLVPESGDTIQAMKAGLLEVADIYVVNKSDLPGAARLRQELASILKLKPSRDSGWNAPIIDVSNGKKPSGHDALDEAIRKHKAFVEANVSPEERTQSRKRQKISEVFLSEFEERLGGLKDSAFSTDERDLFDQVLSQMLHSQ